MNFQGIIAKIKTDTWWSEEAPGNYQSLLTAWRAFILQSNIYGPRFLSICLCIYKNNFGYEKTSEQEKLDQFLQYKTEYVSSPLKTIKRYKKFLRSATHLDKTGLKGIKALNKCSDKELAKIYYSIFCAHTDMFTNSTFPESADVYGEKALLQDIKKSVKPKLSEEKLLEFGSKLSIHPGLSFMEQAHLEFLTESLKKKPDFKKHSAKYHWLQNNYLNPIFLDEAYFVKERKELFKTKTRAQIKNEIKSLQSKMQRIIKEQLAINKILRPNKYLVKIFTLLRLISKWIDQRKSAALKGIYYIDSCLFEIAKRKNVSFKDLGYYLPEEVVKLLTNNKRVSSSVLNNRKKLSVYVTTKNGQGYTEHIFTGQKAKTIFKLFQTKNDGIIKGFVASKTKNNYTGKVQVILNPHSQKFTPGNILVTTMTRPDFMPLMRKAAAVITDEGGITSHAAIVSRELNIPCIIGTKVASKILKNNDMIEMDLNTGIVKKIK